MENNTMTYTTIINAIQLQALNDPTPPTKGSQEYLIYGQMIANLAIPTWENERGTLWQELWVQETNYATISFQSDGTPQVFALPDDFKLIGDGFIWVQYANGSRTSMPVKRIDELSLNPLIDRQEFYVQGNAVNGFQLIMGWVPGAEDSAIGANLSFRYYKHANIPSFDTLGNVTNPADSPEMSDPNFIIYKVAAQVNAANYNMNLYQVFEDKANYSLLQMRAGNDMASNWMDDYVKDVDGLTGRLSSIPNRYNSGYWTGNL